MKSAFISIAFVFCSLTACEAAFAQPAAGDPYIVPSDSSGEIASREIDSMAAESRQSGERLFVIVRLGAGEKSRRLNLGRLYNTRTYLSAKSFDQSAIVFAEGERINGEGRIEFYLGSRLRLVVLAKRNRMPNLTCCEDYFPPAGRRVRGASNQRRS
jgi:hypothetical protein